MAQYLPTIGLEIHSELKTATKMFCNSKNDTEEARPNVNICPICIAHPGTLPTINREAVRHVLRVGIAVGGKLADYTEFDRKNYFYPDLPKGYQISQYEYPLVSGGSLNGIPLTRIHLEEDTASSIHDNATGTTLIDYNRSGVPLMELVTEPVIHSAKEAGDFARELQLLLRYLGASNANMERGEMRVEANVSISKDGKLGTKVELKNINSFRFMEKAVAYEIERQKQILERGETVVQETRGWDDAKQQTFSQRVKEGSADYRYFPDPDLPSLKISEFPDLTSEELLKSLPVLPSQKRENYLSVGLKPADVEQLVNYPALSSFFDSVVSERSGEELIILSANYILNDLVNLVRDKDNRDIEINDLSAISPQRFRKMIDLINEGKISSRGAKDLLPVLLREEGEPLALAERQGLLQKSAVSDLEPIVDDILAKNSNVVADFKAGKAAALEYLVGQCMRALRGAGDPAVLRKLIAEKLG